MMPDLLKIDTTRGRFTARCVGDARHPVALCLHGFADDAGTFDDLLDWLAGHGFRAVAPYRRGYAPSPLRTPAGERDSIDTAGRDVLALADALSPKEQVYLIGHGFGAVASCRAMSLAPDKFARAALLAAGHPGPRPGRWLRAWHAMRSRFDRATNYPDVRELWRQWSPGWEAPAARLANVQTTLAASWPAPVIEWTNRVTSDVGVIRTPTLQLVGERDPIYGPAAAAGQERFFTGPFRMDVIPGVGRFPHLEMPKAVVHQIIDWLAAPSGPVGPRTKKTAGVRVAARATLRMPAEWGRVLSWRQTVPAEWSRFAG
jgi:pimeloyl-ACP methyl ester carboxylesterase